MTSQTNTPKPLCTRGSQALLLKKKNLLTSAAFLSKIKVALYPNVGVKTII